MDFTLSCASNLPWIWVIEALASSNQVDVSLLLDLVEKTQGLFDDPARNARELVALRILEIASVKEDSDPPKSFTGPKFGLNPSESCEDVLKRIVLETSSLSLKSTKLDMLKKWNLRPFIAQKRAKLTKFALQMLKDAISAGSYPIDENLKKLCGLSVDHQPEHSVEEQPEHRVSTICCYSGNVPTVSGRDEHAQCCTENAPLSSPSRDSDNSHLHRSPPKKTSAKRDIFCSTFDDEMIKNNDFDAQLKIAKRYKHDNTCSENFISPGSGPQFAAESEKVVQDTEACRISSEKRNLARCMEKNELSICGTDHGTLSNYSSGHNEVLSRDQVPISDSRDTRFNKDGVESFEGNIQKESVSVNNAEAEVEDIGDEKNTSGHVNSHQNTDTREKIQETVPVQAVIAIEAEKDLNSSINSDYSDERANSAIQKNAFLISQSAYSQDSLSAADWSESKRCLKCGSGEELLMCSSNACPFTVHEICLGSAVCFDRKGRFSCPSCAYSHAITQYEEAKEKASSARKQLVNFLRFSSYRQHANEVTSGDIMLPSDARMGKFCSHGKYHTSASLV